MYDLALIFALNPDLEIGLVDELQCKAGLEIDFVDELQCQVFIDTFFYLTLLYLLQSIQIWKSVL